MCRLVLVPAACLCLKSMTIRNDEWPLDKALVCMINNVNVILSPLLWLYATYGFVSLKQLVCKLCYLKTTAIFHSDVYI